MSRRLRALSPLFVFLLACGADPDALDRAGPESLAGVGWRGDVFDTGDVTIQPTLTFSETSVSIANQCTGGGAELRAEAVAPIRYHYTVDTEAQRAGDDSCFVEVGAGRSSFEVVGGRLEWVYMGERVTFDAAGPVAGVFGDWTHENEVGRFRFSFGGGTLSVSLDCFNGASASMSVNATYRSYIDILESAADETVDGGLTCNASVQAGNDIEYRFEGDTLIMVFDGQDVRFEP